MTEKDYKPTNRNDIAKVLALVSEATSRSPTPGQDDEDAGRFERFIDSFSSKEKLVYKIMLWLFTLFLAFLGSAYFLKTRPLQYLTIAVLAIILVIWAAVMLAAIISGVFKIRRYVKDPYAPFLGLVRSAIDNERQFLEELAECTVGARTVVLACYRQERANMERRGAALSGSIDRLGLFPALAAVAALIATVSKLNTGTEFLYVIIGVIPIFHMMNFAAIGMYQKMDRLITMLELSLQLENADTPGLGGDTEST